MERLKTSLFKLKEKSMAHEDLGSLTDCFVIQSNNKKAMAVTAGGVPLDTTKIETETPAVEHFLYEELDDVVITGTPLRDDNVLTLEAGHNFVAPSGFDKDYLNIHYVDETIGGFIGIRFSQHAVIAVSGNDITISPKLPYDIDVTKIEKSKRVNIDLAVLGSLATPRKFITGPPDGSKWNIRRLMIDMILASQPDDAKFGDISAISNGLFFGFENAVFAEYNVVIFDNGGFRSTAYDVNYVARSVPAGSYGLSMRKTFAGEEKYGSVIVLDGVTNDEFVGYVQDDLSTISRFRVKIMGNIKED